jgi:hypothetical protein
MRKVLFALLAVAVLLAVGDRVAAAYAGRAVAEQLQLAAGLAEQPQVDVRGVPFLTQALRGRYERVEVLLVDVPAGEIRLAELTATLSGVLAPLPDVLAGDLNEVPVDTVQAEALLAYDVLARRSGSRQLTVAPAGDRLRVQGNVRVLGRTVNATAISTVAVDGDAVVVSAEAFEVGNAVADAVLTRALGGQLDLRLPVTGLPYGLQLESVSVEPDGVRLGAGARDVVLRPPPTVP